MPSSGKSTLGVLLAKRLGLDFTDSDLLIQKSEGKLLHELIAERGNEGFLEIENRVNKSITEKNSIIATGGSVVYCGEAMEHLRTLGKVIYLYAPYEEISRRLGDFSHRGVIMRRGNSLEDMYKEREPLYERYADIKVDVCAHSMAESVEKICQAIDNIGF